MMINAVCALSAAPEGSLGPSHTALHGSLSKGGGARDRQRYSMHLIVSSSHQKLHRWNNTQ